MKFKKSNIGPILVFLVSLLTVFIWFFVRQGTEKFTDYSIATHSLGQLAGLVGMTLFALTFLLTTRIKIIEGLFGGLDKVYKAHHLMGIIAFILILFHPLLLVIKFIPSNFTQAAIYLLPSKSLGINLGIIAFLSLILLIVLTIYVNMKYPNWKLSHKFMGIVFIIAFFHSFLIVTDITNYPLLWDYMLVISLIGFLSYIYGSYIGPRTRKKFLYEIESIALTKGKINVIKLKPIENHIRFKPGQFVFVRFHGKNLSKEQHPFSIASAQHEGHLMFAIKSLGDYTEDLKYLEKGTQASIEGPYGKFNYYNSKKSQVWIAGGIGITPFLSMAKDLSKIKDNQFSIDLYYCTRNKSEALFLNELMQISHECHNLRLIPYFSEEHGHINAERIQEISKNIKNTDFFLCGPDKLVSDLSDQLIKKGVSKSSIHKEEFNFK